MVEAEQKQSEKDVGGNNRVGNSANKIQLPKIDKRSFKKSAANVKGNVYKHRFPNLLFGEGKGEEDFKHLNHCRRLRRLLPL